MKTCSSNIGGQTFKASIALIALAGAVQMTKADIIPYSNVGVPTTGSGAFTVGAAGDVYAYYTGSEAGYKDLVGMSINGNSPTSWVFDNQPNHTPGTTQIGGLIDLGSVNVNDIISFWLCVTPSGGSPYTVKSTTVGTIFSTALNGGTYVGFEDLKTGNDYDYNDDTFVFFLPKGASTITTVVPEPTTIVAGALLLLPFGISTLRILRNRKTE